LTSYFLLVAGMTLMGGCVVSGLPGPTDLGAGTILVKAVGADDDGGGTPVEPRPEPQDEKKEPTKAEAKPSTGTAGDAGKSTSPGPGEPQKKPAEEKPAAGDEKPEDKPPEHDVGVMVVTASRVREDAFDIPRSMTILDQKRIDERSNLSIVDSLDDQMGIWVEKRTATTSDPVIRGLSGSNLVALIDSNTLSTFWGEGGFAGDDMYGKIDSNSVERIEVLRGPASVQYGSNALGAVLNFLTRSSPIDYVDSGVRFGGRVKGVYGSAAQEYRVRTEACAATTGTKYLLGWSWADIDDVRGGRGVGVQSPTSGKDCNLDGKFQWMTSANSELTLSSQLVNRRNVHRFYRPTQDNFNDRLGLAANWQIEEPTAFWDEVRANVYYQYKRDRRRWLNNGDRGVAKWRTLTGDVMMVSPLGADNRLTYGLSAHRDYGESPDDEQFTITQPDGTKIKPAPDSIWDNLGGYVMDRWDLTEWFAVTAGLRYDWFRFDADPDQYYNPPSGRPDLDDFTDRQGAVTGGLGVIFSPTREWRIQGDYSRGFRQFAPKFGLTKHAYGVVAPSQLLDPVTADNFEVGTRYRSRAWYGWVTGYYTKFNDFQNIVRGTFQGQDWYDWNNNTVRDPDEDVYVTVGNGDAFVAGVETEAGLYLGEIFPKVFGREWSIIGGFMWNHGTDQTNDIPLRHTHPATGILKLRWDDTDPARGLWWQFTAKFVRHYDRIPPSRLASDPGYLRDPQNPASGLLRPDGLPGYTVLDLRGGVNVNEYATLTLAVENLTDQKYRPAHSRWDAPGINFQVALDVHYY